MWGKLPLGFESHLQRPPSPRNAGPESNGDKLFVECIKTVGTMPYRALLKAAPHVSPPSPLLSHPAPQGNCRSENQQHPYQHRRWSSLSPAVLCWAYIYNQTARSNCTLLARKHHAQCCLYRPLSPGEGWGHPGTTLGLTSLHIAEGSLQRRREEQNGLVAKCKNIQRHSLSIIPLGKFFPILCLRACSKQESFQKS